MTWWRGSIGRPGVTHSGSGTGVVMRRARWLNRPVKRARILRALTVAAFGATAVGFPFAGAAAAASPTAIAQSVAGTANLVAVTCPTSSLCTAVGTTGAAGVVVPINNGVAGDADMVATSARLGDVACSPTSTSCIAVGASSPPGGAVVPIAGAVPGPSQTVTGVSELKSVACPSDTACVAVGTDSTASAGVVVAITGGVAGQAQTAAGTARLTAVACSSATSCVAVGSAAGGAVVVPINDGVPGQAEVLAGDTLFSVACPTGSAACVAVGKGSTTGIVVPIADGVVGSAQTIAAADFGLSAVTCPSAASCLAVGIGSEGYVVQPISSGVAGATQTVAEGGALSDVACSSPTRCVAAGNNFTQQAAPEGTYLPITNGAAEPVQTVSSAAKFSAVACVLGEGRCVAVGDVTLSGPGTVAPIDLGADQLTVSSLTLDPPHPTLDDASITATLVVRNDFAQPVTTVVPSLVSSDPASLKITSGPEPTTQATLDAGDSASFTYTLTPLQAATVSLQPGATAFDSSNDSVTAPTVPPRVVDLSAQDVSIAVTANPTKPSAGGNTSVTATIINKTASALTAVTPSLTSTPANGLVIGAPSPASIASLAPHAVASVSWPVDTPKAGSYLLRASVTLTDPQTGSETDAGTMSLTVAEPGIVVTTTGDQPLPDAAKAAKVCDVDPDTDDNQCTLRAAIELANAIGGADQQSITFAIPGGAMPTIEPATSLPTVTANAAIDGSTQSAGWVQLDGTNAGTTDGIVLTAVNAAVRGLAVTHWSGAGLRLDGPTETVAGNRIGTADGETAAPNVIGVRVEGGNDTVGGTAQTGTAACSSDCNLVSGNSSADVQVCNGGDNASIIGDWVGFDGAGASPFSDHRGITVGGDECPSTGTPPVGVAIGGPTTRPGTAPGNVISGSARDVSIDSSETVAVRGNLIGTDPSGTAPLRGPDDSIGVYVRGADADIGGPDSSDRNVISGLADHPSQAFSGDATSRLTVAGIGLFLHTGVVEGNDIGTDLTGTHALDDNTGILAVGSDHGPTAGALRVLDNVISGNYAGLVDITDTAADTVALQGNRIGTTADGESPLPNHIGVFGHETHEKTPGTVAIGAIRPAGDRSCDSGCNLISGNDVVGAFDDGTVQGNFIGTDLTGTVAIPNGGPAWAPSFKFAIGGTTTTIGGTSSASLGICDLACNLISGNTDEFGAQGAQVRGNVIGLSASGQPLPNAAGVIGIASAGIGGDSPGQGNVIADNTGPAVFVTTGQLNAIDSPSWAVPVFGNAIYGNGGAIEYGPLGDPRYDSLLVPAIAPGTGGVLAPPTISGTTYQATSGSGTFVAVAGPTPDAFNDDVTATSYRIDLYAADSCTTAPQGAIPVAHDTFQGLSSGFSFDHVLVPGQVLTATLTINQQTSTFSHCVAVDGTPGLTMPTPHPGESDTATGNGFSPGENVQAELHSNPVDLGIYPADTNGTVTATFTIPTNTAPGSHHVVLTGLTSAHVVSIPLTVLSEAPAGSSSIQTVRFTSAPPVNAMVGDRYDVTATASSGLPVALSIDRASTEICTIDAPTSGATVTFTSAGSCVVDASQGGDTNFAPATPVSQAISVAPAEGERPQVTTTVLASSSDPSVTGQRVTYIAKVTPQPSSGTVRFSNDGRTMPGCAEVRVSRSTGAARCHARFARPDSVVLRAAYSGDSRFTASRSSALRQVIRPSVMFDGSPSGRNGSVKLALDCAAHSGGCHVTTLLTTVSRAESHAVLGKSERRIGAGHTAGLRLTLNSTGRRLLAKFGKLHVALAITETTLGHQSHVGTLTVVIGRHRRPDRP